MAKGTKMDAGHAHPDGIIGFIGEVFHIPGLSHDHAETDSVVVDEAVRDNKLGVATIWISLALLFLTTVIQAVIYLQTNSVALLADTGHNLVDALNSIPLLLAFYLAGRTATRRFTYGFGRAEDIAGIFIVLSISYSAFHIIRESIDRFFNPYPLENLGLIALAALIGFLGNEGVAVLQIRVGRQIGSDAMIADGLHARVDGVTSLAVLVAVFGAWINLPILDPIIGVVIGIAIIGIALNALLKVFYRLMDAVDPTITNRIEHFAEQASGVQEINRLRAHWVGHRLFVEITAVVDDSRSIAEGNAVAQNIQNALRETIPALGEVVVQIQPSFMVAGGSFASDADTALPGQGNMMSILPPQYQNSVPSAAPMGAAGLKFDEDGNAAWNEIWTDFCDLALAGGPPHRGSLLEPGDPELVLAKPEQYQKVLDELERGLKMVTGGLPVVRDAQPGWIGMVCDSEEMALWLLRAIVVENVSVRREENVLFFPASPNFKLAREIKNVITVVAKTNHYWQEHLKAQEKEQVAI
ncbi:MAG: cation diffusion facilitator family transporter [Ardenticatenaceae bacterium]|nr:cation diffusion facilitator family transporter [Ardenticatenaceae bacterium]